MNLANLKVTDANRIQWNKGKILKKILQTLVSLSSSIFDSTKYRDQQRHMPYADNQQDSEGGRGGKAREWQGSWLVIGLVIKQKWNSLHTHTIAHVRETNFATRTKIKPTIPAAIFLLFHIYNSICAKDMCLPYLVNRLARYELFVVSKYHWCVHNAHTIDMFVLALFCYRSPSLPFLVNYHLAWHQNILLSAMNCE